MSNMIVSILCPNYEDYESYTDCGKQLTHWPDMWPEEKYAEGALWREHMQQRNNYASWMRDNLHWCRLHTPKKKDKEEREKHRERMTRILASLAHQQGWQVKDVTKDGTIIYKTS